MVMQLKSLAGDLTQGYEIVERELDINYKDRCTP